MTNGGQTQEDKKLLDAVLRVCEQWGKDEEEYWFKRMCLPPQSVTREDIENARKETASPQP